LLCLNPHAPVASAATINTGIRSYFFMMIKTF
jgi:hypothetical protein